MNILKFIESFANEELMQSKGSRRDGIGKISQLGKNLALAAIPFGLSSLTNQAYAAKIKPTPANPIGALQLALTLEYLEKEYYIMGLESGVIPPGGRDEKVFMQISAHETDHVDFLIAGLGAANFVPKPTFDFTVGGAFNPFGDYPTFLALAQAFEDTGVRAYKGQAGNLISTPDLLTAALQIHSVEARHASEVRRLRGLRGWITLDERGAGMPKETQAVYNGEENTIQAGYNTAELFGKAAGSEAYDEPISGDTAGIIAGLFIVNT